MVNADVILWSMYVFLTHFSFFRDPEGEPLSVYAQYGIFVGILIIHGIINSVAVSWNGVMNQGACMYIKITLYLIDY